MECFIFCVFLAAQQRPDVFGGCSNGFQAEIKDMMYGNRPKPKG